MPALNLLTDKQIRGNLSAGRHADGGCLYVRVKDGGSKSFAFMADLKINGEKRRIQLGLGGYPALTLAKARQRAADLRSKVNLPAVKIRLEQGKSLREAIDEIERQTAIEEQRIVPTFGEFSRDWLDKNVDNMTSNLKARQQWYSTLETYAAHINPMPLDAIDVSDVLACITPIWNTKHETARRLQQRIFKILAAAKVHGFRKGDNPAQWAGNLDLALPPQKRIKEHHPAMPYRDLPEYYARLCQKNTMSAFTLRFAILTAARSMEARAAQWTEIDKSRSIWSIPPLRMKARKPHTVPLSTEAFKITEALSVGNRSAFVFQSTSQSGHVSETSIYKLMRLTGADEYTIHGFRSAFRDWAGNETDYPRELAEEALAHQLGSVEAAYRRSAAIERRRALMEDWARYLMSSMSIDTVKVTSS